MTARDLLEAWRSGVTLKELAQRVGYSVGYVRQFIAGAQVGGSDDRTLPPQADTIQELPARAQRILEEIGLPVTADRAAVLAVYPRVQAAVLENRGARFCATNFGPESLRRIEQWLGLPVSMPKGSTRPRCPTCGQVLREHDAISAAHRQAKDER